MTELPDPLYIAEHEQVVSFILEKYPNYFTFRYPLSPSIINHEEHFIAIVKSNTNLYYLFDDIQPQDCSIHNGCQRIDFALHILKV